MRELVAPAINSSQWRRPKGRRHFQGRTWAFCDGHAKAIKISSVWLRPGEDFWTYWQGTRQAYNKDF